MCVCGGRSQQGLCGAPKTHLLYRSSLPFTGVEAIGQFIDFTGLIGSFEKLVAWGEEARRAGKRNHFQRILCCLLLLSRLHFHAGRIDDGVGIGRYQHTAYRQSQGHAHSRGR